MTEPTITAENLLRLLVRYEEAFPGIGADGEGGFSVAQRAAWEQVEAAMREADVSLASTAVAMFPDMYHQTVRMITALPGGVAAIIEEPTMPMVLTAKYMLRWIRYYEEESDG